MGKIYTGTAGNDVIVATSATGYTQGDQVNGQGGDDTVTLGAGVTFVSGPGNDTISGAGSGYALWGVGVPVTVDLAAGWAQDGYGGTDRLDGITELHLPVAGATVTGRDADETVFCFGGAADIDLGAGTDQVFMWQIDSSDYVVRQSGDTVRIRGADDTVVLTGVETVHFSDRTIDTTSRGSDPYFQFRYDLLSFVEAEWSQGWWYAGVYNEPQLVSYFPQAAATLDIGADGDMDFVVPLSRGYRTGVDTRYHFQVFEDGGGTLSLDAAMTQATPFIAGSRRAETIYIERYGSEALVSVAHDTAIEGETRTDIPWRFGDLAFVLADPFLDVTAELVPPDTLPRALVTGRDTALDAHSMAVGDFNGDGMDDVLVGDFSRPFVLLQTASGAFTHHTDAFLQSLVNGWLEPTLPAATPGLLIDLHMADFDGDGFDDLVAGWGHATVKSRVFFNDGHGGFSVADSAALPVSVYGAQNTLHMKTFSADFDRDGDADLVILQSRYEPYYGGNYLQFLENNGTGVFTDATAARLGDPLAFPDTLTDRLHWTDFWQVLDVNGDGAMDITGHRVTGSASTPLLYMNDGSGHFDLIEVPLQSGAHTRPVSWGDFDGDGRVEVLTFNSTWNDARGTSSTNTFSVYEMVTPNAAHAIAYDIEGAAGMVAKVLGAVLGPASVQDATYAGIGLSLADRGMGYEALLDLALGAVLSTGRTDESVVELLYRNLVGVTPAAPVRDAFVAMIDSGQFTQVTLARMAADHEFNLGNIDITGLASRGLEYLPAA